MASEQAALSNRPHPSSPMPATGSVVPLIALATLSQDFNDAISGVVSVADARRVGLWVKHAAHASQTDGYPLLLVQISAEHDAPAIGDDSWYPPTLADQTATSEADIGAGVTLPTGADFTKGPNWREVVGGGLLLRATKPASSSEKPRMMWPLEIGLARWMYVAAIQQGDTTNFGTIAIDWNIAL